MNDPLPRFFRLRQKYDAPSVADAASATREAMSSLPELSRIRPGMTVAVGAGSRGITNYEVIVRTVCEELQKRGAELFIVPAMGSHGGATDQGQADVLAHYGITEQSMGVPIKSSMEVVELGRIPELGLTVFQDKNAFEADAVVLVNRIKPHTDFHGPIESGLMKMAAIGLGKQAGAHQFHMAGVRLHHAEAILALAREVLRLSKICFGIGIVENQLHQTARIAAVSAADMERQEMALLEEARRLMPQLPFRDVDLLIVDEMGKNLSGTGLDPNVIRREIVGGSFVTPAADAVRRLYVRSLHPGSWGNATGIGLADFVHDRVVQAMDCKATWINTLTALTPVNARVPMHLPTDLEALKAALATSGLVDNGQIKALWIKNTLSCEVLYASEAYLALAQGRSDLAVDTSPAPLDWDENNDLMSPF